MSGRRVVYGVGPAHEVIKAVPHEIDCIFMSEKRLAKGGKDGISTVVGEAKNRNLRWAAVANSELDRLAKGANHQGVVVVAGSYAYKELHELVDAAKKPGLIVALDGVTDPHNLGAVVRSALLLDADGVVIPKDRSAQVTAMVTKTSAGASEHLPIAQVTNLVRALEELREDGYWSAAVHSSPKAVPLAQVSSEVPLVLVLGSEGKGLRPLVAKTCDFHLEIPMAASAVGSFNVSVAAAIALYEVTRQRAAASA
ncbi:MAG: 23S rRNA (guanosine(2251)-2'-O)-methyltransferase RlmB [Myxococcales bacterium]|nr:23S rRNA (guanosine(2251)-2'-O)-methyltransferase RlmB [Myxococcales bacterium]